MTRFDDPEMPPTLRRLGEHLDAAARREIGPAAPPRRRGRIAALAAAGVALLGAGLWVVTPSDPEPEARLLAVGRPPGGTPSAQPQVAPSQAQPEVPGEDPASDPRPPPPPSPSLVAMAQGTSSTFAIGVSGSSDGQSCVVAGRVRGGGAEGPPGRLPALTGEDRLCAGTTERRSLYGARTYDGDGATTMVFGRAPAGSRSVTVRSPAGTHTAPTGTGGAFLLIYEGAFARDRLIVSVEGQGAQGP